MIPRRTPIPKLNRNQYIIKDKSFDFAVLIVNLYKYLIIEQKEFYCAWMQQRSEQLNNG